MTHVLWPILACLFLSAFQNVCPSQRANTTLLLQVVYDGELICSGTLKKYDVEMRLPKEPFPDDCLKHRPKPPKEITGVDPSLYQYMSGDHWYSLCLRQNLQYGPKFRMVTKYSVDRTWAELRQGTSSACI